MNARTIYKQLMKNRRVSFWGPRAFVTVSFPLRVIPEPVPVFDTPEKEGWTPAGFGGQWESDKKDDKNYHIVNIWKFSGGVPEGEARQYVVIEHEEEATWTEKNGEVSTYMSGSWWEGTEGDIVDGKRDDASFVYLPLEVIQAYAAREKWEDHWLHGQRAYDRKTYEYTDAPFTGVLAALHDAAGWAKTTYSDVAEGRAYITYSVKWLYPRDRRGIAAALHKAFRVAKEEDVDLRLHRAR